MVLRLDGRFATVWRDPFSLQIGVDPAQVVLRDVSTAQERMIAALESGVSRSGLDMIASSSGASINDVSALLRTLKLLLVADEPIGAAPRVSIVGTGQTVERIANTLALAGAEVSVSRSVADSAAEDDCDLGVVVGHYVLDPESYGFWLRRDLPHLPVVFGDEAVMIGPMIEPGSSPCLYCLEHHRRDTDASWSAIASQLWGRRARSETALASTEVATRVARLVHARLELGRPAHRTTSARSFQLVVETGEVTRREWMPHPDCGCIAVPGDIRPGGFGPGGFGLSADPPETGSPRGSVRPTRVEAGVSLA
ncbi:MAG TPA: TOMM precursor leader peptide-binding protein [Galbitalea sp.]|jgi:bacteriocin biosynthesis cyclodehydratase domain-containing protein|nr:TOMM precursor leader peptide-binding protein [Galbitalea sp.]